MKSRDDIIEELQVINAQRGKLYKELERSLALQDLWPGVFNGPRTVTLQPCARCRRRTRRGSWRVDKGLKVTAGSGEVREFTEVPDILKDAPAPPD